MTITKKYYLDAKKYYLELLKKSPNQETTDLLNYSLVQVEKKLKELEQE